ncbi:MAG: lamin tail domain-containing protein [Deltaproteobacteria bacterium]|nr:lamin tail domain-containing protein [Deltaproteobacteria bacterium]
MASSPQEVRLAYVEHIVTNSEPVPTVSLLSPMMESADSPADLGRVIVNLSCPAGEVPPGSFWLEDARGGHKDLQLIQRVPCKGGECLVLEVPERLTPGTWALGIGALLSEEGLAFFPGVRQTFELGRRVDQGAPVITAELRVSDGCAVVEVRASEVVDVVLTFGTQRVFGWASSVHYLALEVPPDTGGIARVEAWDLSKKAALPRSLEVPALGQVPLRIVEVLANPLGLEPRQEFIEILNVSGRDISLDGWSLTLGREDRARMLPSATLRVSGRALLVSGAAVLRLERSLSLANAGEAVRLVGPKGATSSYGGYVDTHRVADGGKSAVRVGRCDVPNSWNKSTQLSTPGSPAANGAPN